MVAIFHLQNEYFIQILFMLEASLDIFVIIPMFLRNQMLMSRFMGIRDNNNLVQQRIARFWLNTLCIALHIHITAFHPFEPHSIHSLAGTKKEKKNEYVKNVSHLCKRHIFHILFIRMVL